MGEQLFEIIMTVLKDVNKDRQNSIDLSVGSALPLYGTDGIFNSMGLVNFLNAVEMEIEDQLQQSVSLASEKAVSRRQSPFTNVKTLIEFIEEELGVASNTDAA